MKAHRDNERGVCTGTECKSRRRKERGEMKRIATEAEENTMRHVLAFMPRLIYCDGFSRFIRVRVATEQHGYSRGRLSKSQENMASARERTSSGSFSLS